MKGLKLFLQQASEQKKPHVADFDGVSLEFHNVRVPALLVARDVVHDVAVAVSAFIDPSSGEYAKRTHVIVGEQDTTSTTVEAIGAETAAARQKKQDAAVHTAISSLLNPANIDALCVLVLDSLREPWDTEAVQSFREQLDVPQLVRLVVEMLKGNTRVFGPLTESLVGKAAARFSVLAGSPAPDSPETTDPAGQSS